MDVSIIFSCFRRNGQSDSTAILVWFQRTLFSHCFRWHISDEVALLNLFLEIRGGGQNWIVNAKPALLSCWELLLGCIHAAARIDICVLIMHQAIFAKEKKECLFVCFSLWMFYFRPWFCHSWTAVVGFFLSRPHYTAWHMCLLSYPSVNKYRAFFSHRKCWMNHPAFLPLPFFSQPSAYLYCVKNSLAVKFWRNSLYNL